MRGGSMNNESEEICVGYLSGYANPVMSVYCFTKATVNADKLIVNCSLS